MKSIKFRPSICRTMYRKELTDILRDRKTLLMMILLPVVLYPLMFFLGIYVVGNTLSGAGIEYVIACDSHESLEMMEVARTQYTGTQEFRVERTRENMSLSDVKAHVVIHDVDGVHMEILYDSTDTSSVSAATLATNLFDLYKNEKTKELLAKNDLDAEAILNPVITEKKDQATGKDTVGNMLGMLLPFLLITSIMMGALYPAIDVTAGEKERGTLETLLTLPVSPMELLTGKFLAVSTISIISALLNMISMGSACILWYGSMSSSNQLDGSLVQSFLPAFAFMLLAMVIFAVLISALLLCVCINCASFKEAQNMTTPFLLIVLIASMAGMLQNMKLANVVAIPVVNVAILIRDVFSFEFDYARIALVFAINLVYAGVVVVIMSRLYNSETILFSDGMAGIHFFNSRKNILKKEGTIPGIGDAVILMGIAIMLILTLGTFLQARFPGVGLLGIQMICLLLPVFMAWYIKCDFKKLFHLDVPKRPITILGSFLLWIGVYLVLVSTSSYLEQLFPTGAKELEAADSYIRSMNPVLLILVVGIAPGICEEVLFRGFLYGTLQERVKPAAVIFITSCLFGLYHMSLPKFFTTSLLGAVNAIALYASGSIFPAMVLHMLNNTLSCLGYVLPETILAKVAFLYGEFENPTQQFAMAGIGVVCAVTGLLVVFVKPKQQKETTDIQNQEHFS